MSGEDFFAPSFIDTQTQDAEQEDVCRPIMDEEEGPGDNEDDLFQVNPTVSTGVIDELVSIGLSTQTPPSNPTPSSVPTNSGSQGKRKRVDRSVKKKRQKMLATKKIVDVVSVIVETSKNRAATISEIQERSVDAAISDLLDM